MSTPKGDTPATRASLPGWKCAVYGCGSFASLLMSATIVTWLLYYASGGPGVASAQRPTWQLGLAMAAGRIVDALADPFVAHWSDSATGRWGRRLPFVVGGALPLGLSFAFLWLPYNDASTLLTALRLGLALAAFFVSYTLVVCPYLAMLGELTDSPALRVRLASWQTAGSLAGGTVAAICCPWLFARAGFARGGLIIGVLAACCFLAVGLAFRREAGAAPAARRPEPGAPPPHPGRGWLRPLAEAWRLVLEERALRVFLAGVCAVWTGLNVATISLPYLVRTVLQAPETAVGTVGLLSGAGTLAALPFVARLAARRGRLGLVGLAAGLLGLVLPLAAGGRAGALAAIALSGPLLAVIYTLPNPALMEIADRRRQATGHGQEALHFGAQGLALQGALALAAWLVGALYSAFGAEAARPGGIRLAFVAAGLLCALGSWFLRGEGAVAPGTRSGPRVAWRKPAAGLGRSLRTG